MPEETTAYCVKEKAKKPMLDVQEVTLANGKHALTGVCSSCGTKLFKFLPDKPAAAPTPAPVVRTRKSRRK